MNASFIGGIIAVVVILLIIAVIKTYNHMVVLRNRVDNQGAQIEVQLKRRADLIPKRKIKSLWRASFTMIRLQSTIPLL